MKKILVLSTAFLIFSCGQKESKDGIGTDLVENSASANGKQNKGVPDMKFEEEEFDFGKMTQGEKVSHSFSFKNAGDKNLVISGAQGSCGCTVAKYPQEPILPGKEEKIEVIFNSEGKRGLQEKVVTIVTNCEPATRMVRIKAEVIVPETAK